MTTYDEHILVFSKRYFYVCFPNNERIFKRDILVNTCISTNSGSGKMYSTDDGTVNQLNLGAVNFSFSLYNPV